MKILLFWTLIIMCEMAQISEAIMRKSKHQAEIKNAKLVIPNVYDLFPEYNSVTVSSGLVD